MNGCTSTGRSTKAGKTVDFFLSRKRDVNAAKTGGIELAEKIKKGMLKIGKSADQRR